MASRFYVSTLLSLIWLLGSQVSWPSSAAAAELKAPPGVALFDTVAPAGQALTGDELAKQAGWKPVVEDDTAHVFGGSAVLSNGRLALVLRPGAAAAELYAVEPAGTIKRSLLRPATSGEVRIAGVKILANDPGRAALEVRFADSAGKPLVMGFELKIGQVFVQIDPGESVSAVRVEAPCRFAVMPDFFADDIVVDATSLPAAKADLPSENFILHMLGDGQAIMMAVWNNRQQDISVSLSGQDAGRKIDSTDIPCAKNGKVWIAILAQPGIWHWRDIASSEAGEIIPLAWKPPMPAIWRVDWRRDDQLGDSWEMLLQRPSGDFIKRGIIGSSQAIPPDRKRNTTFLLTFPYPCWIDRDSQAFLQPLRYKVRFAGPAIIYPLGRLSSSLRDSLTGGFASTPLEAFTVVDIVRNTMGVGPCEYILDLVGQQNQYVGRSTCANRDTLDPIYAKGEQAQRKADIERSLTDVIAFIRHIRSRIEVYVAFGHDIRAYLGEQKRAHPELDKPLNELDSLAQMIDARYAARKEHIKDPDQAAAIIAEFRKSGLSDQGPEALEKCKQFTASIVHIGDNQDELVGECRLAVKLLSQRAALVMASDPRMAEVAKEVRSRAQKVLRNPANHEGARH